ncbi:nickel-dependent lactate racemase [Geomobilimonas luticola]|uniref:Nickel-dependent lactate racemase n=1 Tax=Geomobilimonas luticola TaxID=1114878 RepID=A0ABS5S881_9BACT|nr:nickel-dependent lactate racemase [Geomobilimonas luticola]MBT0651581.1 nickel-dependent lactate racemase [Geomobilimonas luticola]
MLLKYGDTAFDCGVVKGLSEVIRAEVSEPATGPEPLVSAALDACEEHLALFQRGERVVIVTSDITRYTGSEIYLPLLVERLKRAGIKESDIEIVIALGIHRKQTDAEHKKIAGALYGRIRITDHDCDDPGKLVYLGKTGNGVGVEINRRITEADRVILTGTIGFHYFAGFSGGRKAILPGVASRQACMASHFAVLNPGEGNGKNLRATTGNLEGNPVHQAMDEACALVSPDFIFNTVLSPDKRIVAAFAGDWREAFAAGCRYYAEHFTCRLAASADLVVVSCGGFPKDINFIQAHKSMEYGCQALREGGVLVLLAECRDGYGNATFFDWFRHRELPEFEAALRRHYEINGQTAYSTLYKAQRYRVILVSSLPPEEVQTMGMSPAASLDEALAKAATMLPRDYTAYVIPEGGTVLPVIS